MNLDDRRTIGLLSCSIQEDPVDVMAVSMLPKCIRRCLDPGWPWLFAGVLLMVSAAVVPSEQRLLREQAAVSQLEQERDRLHEVSATYSRFLDEVSRGEESLVRRLAAAQLGILPEGQEPLVILSGVTDPPTRWIERAALTDPRDELVQEDPAHSSLLVSMLDGTGQLWVFGASLLLIFVGLLLGPAVEEDGQGESRVSAAG